MFVRRVLVLGVAMALATVFLGWWSVAVIALLWGLVARRITGPVTTATLGAILGWLGLLIWAWAQGPVLLLADKLGGVLELPGLVTIGITLAFPGLLAMSAASLATAVRSRERTM